MRHQAEVAGLEIFSLIERQKTFPFSISGRASRNGTMPMPIFNTTMGVMSSEEAISMSGSRSNPQDSNT